ncbi:uncharacterized protein Dwil_GK18837 [Drosophila willistoni]|uniref:Putative hydroxypyruvate isomerase n=1 Tax=Drosophila willistoni TaxID=7260 RepID=B4NCT5_DROWI|nr:putative hydroxypyruvate isomerase [Drosophila willistoni]EDW82644.1 uncharacterized protein Dwil_GK18837 [Drosophila willistoni]
MALKFAANLNFLFTEKASSIVERICLAHQHGFRAVELTCPEDETKRQKVLATIEDTGIAVSLVNLATDRTKDELKWGSTGIPGAEKLFQQQLKSTIEFAKAAKCQKIHLMSGLLTDNEIECDYNRTYLANLKLAADKLRSSNMIGLVEPINPYYVPKYYMDSYVKAREMLESVQCDNIKLLVDLYHLQSLKGNVTRSLEEYGKQIGHFQIAQVPNRNEPDTTGELDYAYIFQIIQEFGYTDWIGCEYKPKTTTVEGLNWLQKFGFKL